MKTSKEKKTNGLSDSAWAEKPIAMSDEQKFFFDLRGWILLPAVLSPVEIDAMKKDVYDGAKNSYEGSLHKLLDHPAIVGILTEILAEPSFVSDDYYSFRCEGSFTTHRPQGWNLTEGAKVKGGTATPHVVRPPQQANAMRYQVKGNKIFAGLTRVVWELEDVKAGQGGTTFVSGSHKSDFNYGGPDPYAPNVSDSPWEQSIREVMDEYSCPAGSAIVFTESLLHAAHDWTNPDNPRCAVFNCYNSLWAQWHLLNLDHEIIEKMPEKRRTLFRGTWELGELNGSRNHSYAANNRSI